MGEPETTAVDGRKGARAPRPSVLKASAALAIERLGRAVGHVFDLCEALERSAKAAIYAARAQRMPELGATAVLKHGLMTSACAPTDFPERWTARRSCRPALAGGDTQSRSAKPQRQPRPAARLSELSVARGRGGAGKQVLSASRTTQEGAVAEYGV